jgi:hypothetical protein
VAVARVKVFESTRSWEAWSVRDWLDRNGIAADVRGEPIPGVVRFAGIGVWVDEHHVPLAKQCLATYTSPQLVSPEWACTQCGEMNPPAFASCWACGTDHSRPVP